MPFRNVFFPRVLYWKILTNKLINKGELNGEDIAINVWITYSQTLIGSRWINKVELGWDFEGNVGSNGEFKKVGGSQVVKCEQ